MTKSNFQKPIRRRKYIYLSLFIIICISAIYILHKNTNSLARTENETSFEPGFIKGGQLAIINNVRTDTIKIIEIEVADNDEKRMQGMMWRRSMKDSQGMLFIFDREEMQSFWMKNTFIPLDIIYINSDMEIVSIRHNAKPLEEWSIPSEYPAQYVLEVIGGFCYTFNVNAGDRIQFSLDNEKGTL